MIKEEYLTESTKMRNQGNELYKTCTNELFYSLFWERIHKAIGFYDKAFKLAESIEEKFKADKNTALAYLKIFNRIKLSEDKNINQIIEYGKSLLNYYQRSLVLASKLRSGGVDHWELQERAMTFIDDLIKEINISPKLIYEDRMKKLNDICLNFNWDSPNLKAKLLINLAKKYMALGIENFETKCYSKAVSNSEHSLQLTREVLFYSNLLKNEILEEVQDIQDSAFFMLIRSKSYIVVERADKLFNAGVYDSDEMILEYVKDALDTYREALMIADCIEDEAKCDVELEAIILSKLGSISFTILKDREKAEQLVKLSVELGLSLHPRNVGGESWYLESSKILNEIRKQKEKEDAVRMKELKEKYYNDIYEVILNLEAKAVVYSADKFLKYILQHHPPQDGLVFNVDEEKANTNIKKVILKVISFYHPDKHSDPKKKILMEEITKILNRKYEYFRYESNC